MKNRENNGFYGKNSIEDKYKEYCLETFLVNVVRIIVNVKTIEEYNADNLKNRKALRRKILKNLNEERVDELYLEISENIRSSIAPEITIWNKASKEAKQKAIRKVKTEVFL